MASEMKTTALAETATLLEAQIPTLRRYARSLTRNTVDADDLVQDCLTKAMKNLHRWEPGTNLRAWLFVILRNTFLNDRRRSKREAMTSDLLEQTDVAAVPADQEARLAVIEVREALKQLSDEHRETLTLIAIEGLTYEEAAVVLDVAVGTIRSRLSRARAALRDLVDVEVSSNDPPRSKRIENHPIA